MAKPITPTSKLSVKETEAFLRRLDKDLKKLLTFIPTPKLNKALELLNGERRRRPPRNNKSGEQDREEGGETKKDGC